MTEPYDEPVIVLRMRPRLVAFVSVYVRYLGYLVRPYDQAADNRRWFWQHPVPCPVMRLTPDQARILREAIERRKNVRDGS